MQNLRDKLLGAGLVDKKQAREAKTDKRKARRRKGGKKAHADEAAALEAQRQRHKERLAAEAERARAAQEKINARLAERAARARLRDVVRTYALHKFRGNDRAFYFIDRDGKTVRRLSTTHEVATGLSAGELAIVWADDDPVFGYAVVRVAGARRLEELCPERLLFWCKPGVEGDLPAYGSGS